MEREHSLDRPVRGELAPAFGKELGSLSAGNSGRGDSGPRMAGALLGDALHQRVSDVHLDPQSGATRVRFRIDGRLHDVAVLGSEQAGRLLRHLKVMSGLDSADPFHPGDARLTHVVEGHQLDLRLASLPVVGGEKITIRVLDRNRVTYRLDQLGLSDSQHSAIAEWLEGTHGMFLVAGPTGSGKTTMLYSLLHELRLQDRSVSTIEDPVEYRIDGITQTQVDHRHSLTFAEGLRAMLRADPDHLLIGEIRDGSAAHAALEASGSGRVLMSTMHAPDAVSTVTGLRNFGLADHQIAVSLRLVAGQRLVRQLCTRCRKQVDLTRADLAWLASVGLHTEARQIYEPAGCDECRHLGYSGRAGVFEVWRLTEEDYEAILHHADEHSLYRGALSRGMVPLMHDAWAKVELGVTGMSELRAVVSDCYPRRSPRNGSGGARGLSVALNGKARGMKRDRPLRHAGAGTK